MAQRLKTVYVLAEVVACVFSKSVFKPTSAPNHQTDLIPIHQSKMNQIPLYQAPTSQMRVSQQSNPVELMQQQIRYPYGSIPPNFHKNIKQKIEQNASTLTEEEFCSKITSSNNTHFQVQTDSIRIIMVVDETGSMDIMKSATIQAYNEFIDSQISAELDNESDSPQLTLIKFDTDFSVETWSDVNKSYKLNSQEKAGFVHYNPDGGTALYDTLGCVLRSYKNEKENILVIITDGEDNQSKKFSSENVREVIEDLREENNWMVNYVGANQNPLAVSEKLGIGSGNTMSYDFSRKGISSMYKTLNVNLQSQRSEQSILRKRMKGRK